MVKIYWGDELIESNASGQVANADNNASWDYVYEVNGSNPVSLGVHQGVAQPLSLNTTYYYRAYAENLGGFSWAPTIETFKAIDTRFTKDTMDGMVLWLDAMDVDADGLSDSQIEGTALPLWVDKSNSGKNATQNVANKTPTYSSKSIGSLPSIRFGSGHSYNIGSLRLGYGGFHVFMVAQGTGVGVGGTDGLLGWTLDAKPGKRIVSYKSENNVLRQITLGFDPRTGFGQLGWRDC